MRAGGHVVGGEEISRLCARMRPPGRQAETPELRDKLIELARVWMDAALTEEEAEEGRLDLRLLHRPNHLGYFSKRALSRPANSPLNPT